MCDTERFKDTFGFEIVREEVYISTIVLGLKRCQIYGYVLDWICEQRMAQGGA